MTLARRLLAWLSAHLLDIFPPEPAAGAVADPQPLPPELLLADPSLMGSPEGDWRGLRELQEAAQAAADALGQHRIAGC